MQAATESPPRNVRLAVRWGSTQKQISKSSVARRVRGAGEDIRESLFKLIRFLHILDLNGELVHDLDPREQALTGRARIVVGLNGHGVQELKISEMTSLSEAAGRPIEKGISKFQAEAEVMIIVLTVVEEQAGWVVVPFQAAHIFPLLGV